MKMHKPPSPAKGTLNVLQMWEKHVPCTSVKGCPTTFLTCIFYATMVQAQASYRCTGTRALPLKLNSFPTFRWEIFKLALVLAALWLKEIVIGFPDPARTVPCALRLTRLSHYAGRQCRGAFMGRTRMPKQENKAHLCSQGALWMNDWCKRKRGAKSGGRIRELIIVKQALSV